MWRPASGRRGAGRCGVRVAVATVWVCGCVCTCVCACVRPGIPKPLSEVALVAFSSWICPGTCACEVIRSLSVTLVPLDHSPSGSSVLGILQARILEWGAIFFSRHQRASFASLTLAGGFFIISSDTSPRSTPRFSETGGGRDTTHSCASVSLAA